jgi:hypothetical protein
MFAGFGDACCEASSPPQYAHLTGNDVAISQIESKLLEPLSVNVKKGATGRQRTWRPVARPGFGGGGGGNRTRIYITDSKKNSLAGFAAIERILR